jgi:hypothetical protein
VQCRAQRAVRCAGERAAGAAGHLRPLRLYSGLRGGRPLTRPAGCTLWLLCLCMEI